MLNTTPPVANHSGAIRTGLGAGGYRRGITDAETGVALAGLPDTATVT